MNRSPPAAALYVGNTWHRRFGPRAHAFRYGLFQLLIDVDRAAEVTGQSRLLRQGRFGIFSFTELDHGYRDGRPLRQWVENRLSEAGMTAPGTTIQLLALPRVLGFIFNPISIFFVSDPEGQLLAIIYEVNNTFGQTHAYVVPAKGRGPQRHRAEKRLYVSPFYGVEGGYEFSISPPEETFHLAILKTAADGRRDFAASLNLVRKPLSDPALLGLFFAMPLVTLKVVAAIHWEALRLWLKGAPFGVRPRGPNVSASLGVAQPKVLSVK